MVVDNSLKDLLVGYGSLVKQYGAESGVAQTYLSRMNEEEQKWALATRLVLKANDILKKRDDSGNLENRIE